MEINNIIKKVILVVAMAFMLNGYSNTSILKPKEMSIKENTQELFYLNATIENLIKNLKTLRNQQSKLKKEYFELNKKLESLNPKMESILGLIEINKHSIEECKNAYNKSLDICKKLSNEYNDKCMKDARKSYDEDLKSVGEFGKLILSTQVKLESAIERLRVEQVLITSRKENIMQKIKIIEKQIKVMQGDKK